MSGEVDLNGLDADVLGTSSHGGVWRGKEKRQGRISKGI